MLRRDIGTGLLSILLGRRAIAALELQKGQPLRLFERGRARVFVLGFGEAKDESWAAPQVRRAFQASGELWLEVSRDPGSEPDSASKREQLTRDPNGRSFFDVLEPEVRARAQDYCSQLGVAPERIEKQRPWSAFYTNGTKRYRCVRNGPKRRMVGVKGFEPSTPTSRT
jgi:uncharacterized protein YbaP (TraB family)